MSGPIHRKLVTVAVLAACTAAFSISCHAGENTWTTSGPYGGLAPHIVFDTLNPSVAYAVTLKALYKSTDAGATWAELSFDGGGWPIAGIAVDPANAGRFYVAGEGGLFRSNDGGASFQKLAVPSRDPNISTSTGPAHVSVSRSGATIYVTTINGPAYISTDAGATFSVRPRTDAFPAILIHPTDGSLFYGLGPSDVLTSADAGVNWTTRAAPFPIHKLDLALTTDTADTLWLVSPTGVVQSTDSGASWTQSLPVSFPWLSHDPNTPGVLYAGTARTAGPVHRYQNGSWQQLTGALPSLGHRIAQPPGNASVLLASTGLGLHRSEDGGASWIRSDHGVTNWRVLALATSKSTIFVGPTGREVAWATGAGAWNRATLPIDNEASAATLSMAVHPSDANIVLAGTTSGVYRSIDGGAQWAKAAAPIGDPTAAVIDALAFNPNDPRIVYATHRKALTTEVIRSNDQGQSFEVVSEDLPEVQFVSSLMVDPHSAGHVLLAGTDFQQLSGLFRSTDRGVHWSQVINEAVGDVTADAVNANRMYAWTNSGLRLSTDGGATWTALTTIPASVGTPFNVEADPKRAGVLYTLATLSGPTTRHRLLRSVDAGQTWETIEAPSVPHWVPNKIAIAPDQPSVVHVSVDDRSVYAFEIAPDLSATIQGHGGQRTVSTSSTFAVHVRNNGPLAATDVRLQLALPSSAQNVSASTPNGQCAMQASGLQCLITVVRNQETLIVNVNYTPTAAGPLDMSASVSALERDPQLTNNTAAASATAAAAPPPSNGGGGGAGGGGGGAVSLLVILLLAPLCQSRRPRTQATVPSYRLWNCWRSESHSASPSSLVRPYTTIRPLRS